jgi:hypothetical protein
LKICVVIALVLSEVVALPDAFQASVKEVSGSSQEANCAVPSPAGSHPTQAIIAYYLLKRQGLSKQAQFIPKQEV